ncbi:mannose-6-phosphate isomerase, class I [Amphibacillus xylanus]|uniref:Mannose-6-phosphate isomerase n=1 Tax=Amphibacillus xylanus (strain ATCC 51415 / DSM 6626 / JCM 7361 / LMG 17667 / NBRC 15112 / Ep01) TaxID=698758 RepID=K0J5S0_AMPXN|nr:mannose-6-phosphate isomerase, class I [Amphibacillus xylanus]BAM48386.1 mannose-6-phosphate isomerase [Amphibacillus xylanus NBRC 15112]
MYNEPIFLKPVFQERIWGGDKLKSIFNYNIPNDKTGEAWVISAHENGPSQITNGPLANKTLKDAWEKHPELFNKTTGHNEAYPLLVKILDANDNLSIQVHPDDKYAQEIENEPYGKTECWYVLDAEEGAEIVFGHHANSKAQLEEMAKTGQWEQLFRRIPAKKGDFVYVPSGTIHAIGAGIVILETQQSSDITYRVYDYDRTDDEGNPRELHLDSSIEVTTVPHQVADFEQTETKQDNLMIKKLIEEQYFTVYHWNLTGLSRSTRKADFIQLSMIEGEAEIITNGKSFSIKKGDHFVIPATIDTFEINGTAELIVSHP